MHIPAQRQHDEHVETDVYPPEILDEICVMCLKRPALPHNGGLCGQCASPLEPGRHQSRIRISLRHLAA